MFERREVRIGAPTSIGVGVEDGELEDIENVEQYDYDERYAQQP